MKIKVLKLLSSGIEDKYSWNIIFSKEEVYDIIINSQNIKNNHRNVWLHFSWILCIHILIKDFDLKMTLLFFEQLKFCENRVIDKISDKS